MPISNPLFKLVLVHAKPYGTSTLKIVGPGFSEVLLIVAANLKKRAAKLVEKAKEVCQKKSVIIWVLLIVKLHIG
ncbi:hypothetical protein QN277_018821 [Acacia crassicarpa]|uniref:Uncharacterized protein n=1 Tax=Acacia crassicarpa TaxID=499986 RepID=A0AAE1MRY5_9FABA|nr:hypothetical protein QN277_018821 [Acacia crassicarpa]